MITQSSARRKGRNLVANRLPAHPPQEHGFQRRGVLPDHPLTAACRTRYERPALTLAAHGPF